VDGVVVVGMDEGRMMSSNMMWRKRQEKMSGCVDGGRNSRINVREESNRCEEKSRIDARRRVESM